MKSLQLDCKSQDRVSFFKALEKEAEAGAALDQYEVEGPDRAEILTNLGEFQLAVVDFLTHQNPSKPSLNLASGICNPLLRSNPEMTNLACSPRPMQRRLCICLRWQSSLLSTSEEIARARFGDWLCVGEDMLPMNVFCIPCFRCLRRTQLFSVGFRVL